MARSNSLCFFQKGLHSLKLAAKALENRPKPKRKRESIPSIHVQVLLLLVSERVIQLMLTLFPTILEVENGTFGD